MAGSIRQPIDIPALEKYIDEKVSEIKTPLDIKQVQFCGETISKPILRVSSSATVNQTLHIY